MLCLAVVLLQLPLSALSCSPQRPDEKVRDSIKFSDNNKHYMELDENDIKENNISIAVER